MKTIELFNSLKGYYDRNPDRFFETEPVIIIQKPSMGPRAAIKVKDVSFGIDWEKPYFCIEPEKPLVVKTDKEKLWDAAGDILMCLATTPTKRPSYLVREARRIYDALGVDYMKYQHLFHKVKNEKETKS